MIPQELVRVRRGFGGMGNLAGLTPAGGSNTVSFPDGRYVRKVLNIKPTAVFGGQKAGDGLIVHIARSRGGCTGTVTVEFIDVRYKKNAKN